MTTAKDLAARLNGRGYRNETTRPEEREAEEGGLVIVFGASDDLMELRGAVNDEIDSFEGGTAYFTSTGLLTSDCKNEDCPYFEKLRQAATPISAKWDTEGYSWVYETAIPHAVFNILEYGDEYCRGIVFALSDVPA